jgi:uncharacterized protein (DUF433 family)
VRGAGSQVRRIQLSEELDLEIRREAERRGMSRSVMTSELLEEAIRTRRAPGVLFVDGPAGRRAEVAGTGLDVWEVIATWQEGDRNFCTLQQNYPWLSEPQLRAALAYYQLYPGEIDARLAREEGLNPETLWQEAPFLRPRSRCPDPRALPFKARRVALL